MVDQIMNKESLAEYYAQDLSEVWSYPAYEDSWRQGASLWRWKNFPFSNDLSRRAYRHPVITHRIEGKSILEVGSAMGGAYEFMQQSGLVDTAKYVGVEVSRRGFEVSSQRFPQAKWIHADFSKYVLDKKYDYTFELDAVHHMPEPIAQLRKMLEATNISMITAFRGCVRGKTVSDLSRGFFRPTDGPKYFCNIISLFEVVNLGLDLGFSHIRIVFGGLQEPISSDPQGEWYLDSQVSREGRLISMFQVRFSRLPEGDRPKLYVTANPQVLLSQFPIVFRIQRVLSKISAIRQYCRL
ncbi:MAG: hypothetical protein JW384_03628 [Nitrosomonadaceae bacterium]|nr:hypothetical protein [Nitrosomonadaceae bacterium]